MNNQKKIQKSSHLVNPASDKKVPELRFPEFSEEWKKKKLGDVAKFSKGKGIGKSDIEENGVLECIRYGELYTHYREVIEDTISRTNIEKEKLVLSEANDIIIPSSGETALDIAKASCVLKSGVALGGDLNILKTKFNGVYLSYYLNSNKKKDIARYSQGISVIHLYSAQLKLLEIFFPTLPEQTKIANFLSAVDKKIENQNLLIENLKRYKKGVMQQIFSQKLRFKPVLSDSEGAKNGQNFPDWEWKHGNEIFKTVSDKNHNSDLPILAITQDKGAIPRDEIDYKISVTEKSVDSYKVVQIGDFIISLRSFQGGIEYSNVKGICSPAYIILRPHIEIEDMFYKDFLKTERYIRLLQTKLEGIRDGKMISYKYFSEIKLPYPSLPEQKKIANFLSALDKKIENAERKLEHLKEWKKGLLQKMFV